MKAIVFADLHYYGGDISTAVFNTRQKLVAYSLPFLDEICERAENMGADVCVNLGDSIQDSGDREIDRRALDFIFGKFRNMPCPCYSILGNHDLKMMNSREEAEKTIGYESSTYSVDVQGYHLVFLTTSVRAELGTLRGGCYKTQIMSDEEIEWLRIDLEKNTLPAIIFTHFPIAEDKSIDDECMFMKNREAVKEIIRKDKNVLAVFSGHQHVTKLIEEDGVKYYLLGSLIALDEDKGSPDGVYFELELDNRRLTVTEHHFNAKA